MGQLIFWGAHTHSVVHQRLLASIQVIIHFGSCLPMRSLIDGGRHDHKGDDSTHVTPGRPVHDIAPAPILVRSLYKLKYYIYTFVYIIYITL